MNLNQKKQIATICTTIASIILTGLITSIFSGKIGIKDYSFLQIATIIGYIYYAAIRVLAKKKRKAKHATINK